MYKPVERLLDTRISLYNLVGTFTINVQVYSTGHPTPEQARRIAADAGYIACWHEARDEMVAASEWRKVEQLWGEMRP